MLNDHLTPRQTPIATGETAPDFTLMDQDRNDWTLSEALKSGDVVLCFYPMDFSSVCSTEMKCATDEMAQFTGKGAQVVGVSCDSFFTHAAWAESLGLKLPLLADMHRSVCKAYGLYFADLNVAARGTIVIGQDGTVKWVQAREIGNAMDLDEVIAAIS
ncbi:MAG: redoxin domain-containing protein [Planctomycetota bacterium]